MQEGIITKTETGFNKDYGFYRCKYDNSGKYLGQFQDDIETGEPLWFATYPGDECYHELTEDEMKKAT